MKTDYTEESTQDLKTTLSELEREINIIKQELWKRENTEMNELRREVQRLRIDSNRSGNTTSRNIAAKEEPKNYCSYVGYPENSGIVNSRNIGVKQKPKNSCAYVGFRQPTGLRDRNNREILGRDFVQILTDSTPGSPFYGAVNALVIGTAHNKKRVWLQRLETSVQSDREPRNVVVLDYEG